MNIVVTVLCLLFPSPSSCGYCCLCAVCMVIWSVVDMNARVGCDSGPTAAHLLMANWLEVLRGLSKDANEFFSPANKVLGVAAVGMVLGCC